MRLAVVVLLLTSTISLAGDWPAFRGPRGNGIATEGGVPTTWSPTENVLWKFPLPGPGNSSPIVVGSKVFITCATEKGKKRTLYCLNRQDGTELWSKTVEFLKDDPTHGTNPYSGSTPASDGTRVVVFEGSAGVHCYDLDGKPLWSRDLGEFRHIWGYGQSPIFHQGRIILNCGPGERTFVTALKPENGETIWQTDEPGGKSGDAGNTTWTGSWSTPQIATVEGQEQILVSFPKRVNAYDPADGKILWTVDGLGALVYTSVVLGDGVGVAMGGFHGPAIGFKLGGTGNVTETNRLWQVTQRNPQRIGSGIIQGDLMYMINEQGIAQCLEVATGKDRWGEARLPGGPIWGSPILVDGLMFVTNQKGTTLVIRPNPEKLELVGQNELREPSNSTPAVSDGQFLIRTFKNLWCIGKK
jgi:outer membrane protein assembly factor BamB